MNTEVTKPDEKPVGIGFVYDECSTKLSEQLQLIETLDTKISIIIGFASGIIVIILTSETFFQRFLSGFLSLPEKTLLILGVVFWVVSLVSAFVAFLTRKYATAPNPGELVRWANEKKERIQVSFIGNIIEAYEFNRSQIDKKVRWLKGAIAFTVISIGSLIIFILLKTLA